MGIFSSLKRLFFVGESVAKSAAEKTGETIKEGATDISRKAKEVANEGKDLVVEKTSGLRESIIDGAEDAFEKSKEAVGDFTEKAKEVAEDVTETAGEWFEQGREKVRSMKEESKDSLDDASEEAGSSISEKAGAMVDKGKEVVGDLMDKAAQTEVVKKAAEISENVGDKVLTAGEQFMEKAKDISESVGEKVLQAGGEKAEQAGELSEKIGEKVLEAKDAIVERAKEVSADLGEKLDETIEKAQKMAEEEAKIPKKEFGDETLDAGGSLLDGTDDFFAKAAKFGEGDYDMSDKKDSAPEITEHKRTGGLLELPDDDGNPKAAGFTDHDGDGDEIIDDAVIVDEEE
jgi:hypothetical protein